MNHRKLLCSRNCLEQFEQNGGGFYKPEHVNTAIEAKDESEGKHDGSGEDNHYRLLLAPLWPVEE